MIACANETKDAEQIEQIFAALRTVRDPEISASIVDLGLIYNIRFGKNGEVIIDMTLTTPACPVAGSLPNEAEQAVRKMTGLDKVTVNLVWTPPWTPEFMDEAIKLQLNLL